MSCPLFASEVAIDKTLRQIETASGCIMTITSGYRSKARNRRVGGAKRSFHLTNRARDIKPKKRSCISMRRLGYIASKYASVIVYPFHVHIDNRKKKLYIVKRSY